MPGHLAVKAQGIDNVGDNDAAEAEAIRLAREVAGTFHAVTLLHCADPETQALVMPEQPDLRLQQRLNAVIAGALLAEDVDVAVQVVDRAAYLAWLDGRTNSVDWRVAFRDRARLIRGVVALEVLGVAPPAPARRKAPSRPTGTPADRLVRAWLNDDRALGRIADEVLDAGRQAILDMAVRKLAARRRDGIRTFMIDMMGFAETAETAPGTWAELLLVPATIEAETTRLPDPAPLAEGLQACGYFAPSVEVSFLAAWFDADDLLAINPCDLRKTLREVAAGRLPSAVTPLDAVPAHLEVSLLGVSRNDFPIFWEEALKSVQETDPGYDDPVRQMREDAYDAWQEAATAATPGLEGIGWPTSPSEMQGEREDFVPGPFGGDRVDAGADANDTEMSAHPREELEQFVAIARREAGGEALVCVPRIISGEVELALYTRSGRLLDTSRFGTPEQGGIPAALRADIETLVPVVDRPPG